MIKGKKITPTAAPGLNIDFNASIHNRFDVEVIDTNTGEVRQRAVGYNVICDQLWSYLFNNGSYFNYIFYGGGTGTPTASDTALFSYIGGAAAASYTHTMDFESGVHSVRRSIQLNASTAAGQTITEVGIAYSGTQSTLCTHAMLQDMNGNPISIQKTATDVVNIYATIYIHFPATGFSGGSIHLYYDENKPEYVSEFNADLFQWLSGCWKTSYFMWAVEFSPYGGYGFVKASQRGENLQGYIYCTTDKSYDITNKKVTVTVNRVEASAGNLGGYRSLALVGRWSYGSIGEYIFPQIVFQTGGTWYPYTAIANEAVGVGDGETKDFSLAFPFAHDVTVKINGEAVTGVQVDYAPNKTTDWQYYMEGLDSHSTPSNLIRAFYAACSYGHESNKTRYFYNPMYAVGIRQIEMSSSASIYASDDMENWSLVGTGSTIGIGDTYKNCKYWKREGSNTGYIKSISCVSSFTGKTLHFDTAPAEGDVITADYRTDTVAKDENYVFDMTVTIQLGEYTED